MTNLNLDQALDIARSAITTAGKELKQHYGNVESLSKGTDSLSGIFTELDRTTEKYFEAELGKFSPEVGFRGEEFGTQTEGDTTWLVDPIDGTAHFIRGMPFCTSMIALIDHGQVVVALIHNIYSEDTYWAVRGKGAYCNDQKISVSDRSLRDSILSFETKLHEPENLTKYLALRAKTHMFQGLGSGFELSMVASGKLDGKLGLDPYGLDWDFAPGSLLIKEAGGVVANIGKDTYDYKNHDFIMTNAKIYDELTSGKDAIFPLI